MGATTTKSAHWSLVNASSSEAERKIRTHRAMTIRRKPDVWSQVLCVGAQSVSLPPVAPKPMDWGSRVMVTYAQTVDWTRYHDLIVNRASIINQLHDCRYDNAHGNPCRVRYLGGCYELTYCGVLVAAWKLYDVEGAREAFERSARLERMLWNGRRTQRLVLLPC